MAAKPQERTQTTRPRQKTPFSISPNPNLLFFTPNLEHALERTRYTLDYRQGLTVIFGDVGTGKSSLLRYVWNEYDAAEDWTSIMIPNPSFKSEFAMLQSLAGIVGLTPKRSFTLQMSAFETWLAEQFGQDRGVAVFLDEAQKLSNAQLELVRDFLNFETNEEKLIQVVLAGQLELGDRLKTPTLKAINSRMSAPSILKPMTEEELSGMIAHRCEAYNLKNPFTPDAVSRVYLLSKGVPRTAIRLCAIAYSLNRLSPVTPAVIDTAFVELQLEQLREIEQPAEELQDEQ